jgi:hypothetical protein
LRFDAPGAPTRVTLHENGVPTPLAAGNPVRFAANYAVGFHTFDVSTLWLQGDVGYRVRLDVRAGRSQTLTG